MRIKKTFQGNLPENTVVNTQSDSQTNAYSCDYLNQYINSNHCEVTSLLANEIGAWSGATTVTANLSGNISNYDMVIAIVRGDWNHCGTLIWMKGYLWPTQQFYSFNSTSYYGNGYILFPTNTSIKVVYEGGNWGINVNGVLGVKFK